VELDESVADIVKLGFTPSGAPVLLTFAPPLLQVDVVAPDVHTMFVAVVSVPEGVMV
jgi:hypothetical protein